jgi:Ca2+-binding RTX toxin-like protein
MSFFEPLVRVDADGNITGVSSPARSLQDSITGLDGLIASSGSPIETHSGGTAGTADFVLNGNLGAGEQVDFIGVNLVAGVTYTFTERGLEDPYLLLYGPDGHYITEDDDGGLGRSSMITITPTTSGTYYLGASSWYHLDPGAPGYPSADAGDYTIAMWQANPAADVGATFATAAEIDVGTTYGNLEAAGDRDMYAIDLAAGQLYSFTYNGGVASSGDFDGAPGESLGVLRLFDGDGNLVASGVNYETGISLFAEESGTYYLRVDPYQAAMTGGYTVDVAQVNPADYDPLDAINWRNADNVDFVDVDGVPTAYVYFAPAGENFGERADDGTTPMTTYGWQQFQIDGVMAALDQYEQILGVNYEITTDPDQATFRLLTTESELYGARFYPQDPAYGSQQGIGTFNLLSGGFTLPQSLQPGGYSFGVILHEFGHAHGLSHPHDTGGGSDVMLGVNGSQGSLGVYDLNQGVYTVMSYNDGWQTGPDGPQPFTYGTIGYGWSGSLSAFDIAELQERYGVHEYNSGDNVYQLAETNAAGTYFETIWDSGGNDTISYAGLNDAQIDLLAATLDYSPTGGGVVSFAHGVHGGYTIANGVVIENASGGEGNDVILGNSAANILDGNDGMDTLFGREGNDTLNGGNDADALNGDDGNDILNGGNDLDVLNGGAGNDTLNGGNADDILNGGAGNDSLLGGNGVDTLNGGGGDDTLNAGRGADLFVFTDGGHDTIVGYESGEDIDLSAFHVTIDDVTVTSTGIVVDLDGAQDLTIAFNTRGFSASDLIFEHAAQQAQAAHTAMLAASVQSDHFLL